MKKILATSKTCGPCHMLKSKLTKSAITVDTRSVDNLDDISWFREKNIKSVPVLIIEDDQGVELDRILGVEDIFNCLNQ